MRIGWIGFHMEGLEPLHAVLLGQTPLAAIVTLEPQAAGERSGAARYERLAGAFGVPLHYVRSLNDERGLALLRDLSLDLAFVIGWTQIISPAAMALVRRGLIGAHASLLPQLRGRAPVNWAIIRGLTSTGNSLMWLSARADRGDVIDQTVIPITPYDSCATVYEKVGHSNAEMITRVLPTLLAGGRPGTPQPDTVEPDLPGRRPADGIIEWAQSSRQVYNFVRALTRPYPGAWSWMGPERYRIWQAAMLPNHDDPSCEPGTVLGASLSPRAAACGLVVACQRGHIILLELEDDSGRLLTGTDLSDRPWIGRVWRGQPA